MSTHQPKWLTRLLSLGLCLLVGAVVALAQSDNVVLSGYVKDQMGAVVPNAKVTVQSETRAFERSAVANGDGYFVITSLPPGLYTVTVEASGFKLFKESGRKLDPNLTTRVEVMLQTGQVTEVVNITASTTQVQSESATVGKLVETKQVEYLQLNGRNPL
jgi:Carboxypeptidase regulatory-like domain